MAFVVRPYRRFSIQCPVLYSCGPFNGIGTVSNFSMSGWRVSGDLPMRAGEMLSLSVTLPNKQRINISGATVSWSKSNDFAVETKAIEPHTAERLRQYVKRLVRGSVYEQ